MGSSIVLDPYDIYMLTNGLNKSFDELLAADEAYIELSMADGLLLPNIKMGSNNGCGFLNSNGRCSIHSYRPGICRLFPLGRIYEEASFSYFNQIYECDYQAKSKVKIKKWLGIDNLKDYEAFVLKWHDYLNDVRRAIDECSDFDMKSKIMTGLLKKFYKDSYNGDESFYEQFNRRIEI